MAEFSSVRPTGREVADFHTFADTDQGKESIHHSIGPGVNQAASGAHIHDGNDSPLLLDGVVIAGAKGGNSALASVISALVGMGATDNTTA
jgi:hypothetical protein